MFPQTNVSCNQYTFTKIGTKVSTKKSISRNRNNYIEFYKNIYLLHAAGVMEELNSSPSRNEVNNEEYYSYVQKVTVSAT